MARSQVAVRQRVKPWWKTEPSGQIVTSIKFGEKPIAFEEGKAGIVVLSKLRTVITRRPRPGTIGKTRKAA